MDGTQFYEGYENSDGSDVFWDHSATTGSWHTYHGSLSLCPKCVFMFGIGEIECENHVPILLFSFFVFCIALLISYLYLPLETGLWCMSAPHETRKWCMVFESACLLSSVEVEN